MNEENNLHFNHILVDGHCDTLLELLSKKRSFWEYNKDGHLDYPRLKEGKVNLQFLAFYIEPHYKPTGALVRLLEMFSFFQEHFQKGAEALPVITHKQCLEQVTPNSHSLLLTIEGGEVLEGKLGILRILHQLGFRSLTLTWNQRNQLADGIWEKNSRGGLTTFGQVVVREMNQLGMLIDVSHLSERGYWDVLETTQQPIAATHSCCQALCNHPRNLNDTQLKGLKNNSGIIGINFYPEFLGGSKVNLDRVAEHMEHAVELCGCDHVGLGSDFDGITQTPQGLESVAKLPQLTACLQSRGWKEQDIAKVLGGNYIRVLQNVLPHKTS